MITSEQLARQMAVYSVISKTKNVSAIADAVGLSPLQVTNAVFAGEELGLFTVKRDKKQTIDKIEVSDEQYASIALTPSNFGEAVENLYGQIAEFIVNRNGVERDVEETTILMLARVPDVMVTVALELIKSDSLFYTYEHTDPLDKKSVYTYYTKTQFKDKKWSNKDFKKKAK